MALPTTQQQEDIAAIYAALWNRAPDPVGFGYWVDLYANGMSIDTIADAFRVAPEGQAAYPIYMTAEQFVAQVYENVFSRAPDAAGEAYWVGLLTTGGYTEGELITLMVDSAVAQAAAGNEDGQLFLNKVDVGLFVAMDYLTSSSTQEQIDNIVGNAFRYVTSSESSVQTSIDYIAHQPNGNVYNLTTAQDVIYGAAGNDIFQANLAALVNGSPANTLTVGDRLYGGDGWDILDATLTDSIAAGTFTLNEFEQVNLSGVGGNVTTVVNSFSGVELIQVEEMGAGGISVGGLTTVDLSLYNVEDVTVTVNGSTTATVQTLYLDNADNATVILNDNVSGATTAELDLVSYGSGAVSLAVTGDITAATTLDITANAVLEIDVSGLTMANMQTLNIDGSADVDLSNASLALSSTKTITINAADATGNLDLAIANNGGRTLVADLGAGDDVLDITANTASRATVTVDMGAGDDTVEAVFGMIATGQSYVTLVGGEGDDVLSLANAAWGTQVNDIDFSSANVSGIETLNLVSGITLASAADITFDSGFSTVDFDGTITFSGSAGLTLNGLEDNATLVFSTVDAAGTTNDTFDLTVDAAGDLTFEFAALATFDTTTGLSVANEWSFTNATELSFSLGTTDVDVTIDLGGNTGAAAVLYADDVATITIDGGATTSSFEFDISGLVTESSDLTSLSTIDFSGFNGTFTLDLGSETGVIDSPITINLTDGVVGASDSTVVGTVSGSAVSDTYVFGETLVGEMVIGDFANNHGTANSDYLNLSALGVTGLDQLAITHSGDVYTITSDQFDGVIQVTTLNGALLASDFIFA